MKEFQKERKKEMKRKNKKIKKRMNEVWINRRKYSGK